MYLNNRKKIQALVLAFLSLMLLSFGCASPKTSDTEVQSSLPDKEVGAYDEAKAKAYGADDYGMKKYVMAFLKKGPNRDLDSTKAAELQAAHMANIGRMAEAGKLVLAGPFFGNEDLRGIYIFNVESLEEGRALTETDPAIQAGSLVLELKEWYGSAALMGINEVHSTLAKTDP